MPAQIGVQRLLRGAEGVEQVQGHLPVVATGRARAGRCPGSLGRSPEAPKQIQDQWIVRFDAKTTAKQARDERDASKKRGAKVHYEYSKVFQGFAATLTEAEVARLRANPHVLAVEPNSLPTDLRYTYSATGAGVTAYVIDTGIRSTHGDFGGRVAPGFDAIGDGWGSEDCNGHGTHVAGTVGGAVYGVAKQVTLVPVRVLGCGGSGSNAGVIAGVDW